MSEPAGVGTGTGNRTTTDDLIVVSNRQPYRHAFDGWSLTVDRPTGGLVAGLDPVLRRLGGTWIAWGDGPADAFVTDDDGTVAVPPDDPAYTLQRVSLEQSLVAGYYRGYANQSLWPLCHAELEPLRFVHSEWTAYREANDRFARAAAANADAGSTIWLQDYHLALAPAVLRDATDAFIMQFWHIPWPAPTIFRTCPHRTQLLEGLLGNDLLGFHLDSYGDAFLDCVANHLSGATLDRDRSLVRYNGHTTAIATLPLGVDVETISSDARASDPETIRSITGVPPDRPTVLGVDRLDYTKGIPERLAALEHLWATNPSLHESFTYVQKAELSRSSIPAYQRLQETVRETVSRINDRFGTATWQPIRLVTDHLDRQTLCGLYRDADVALVTPRRDGMNLVAQEYVASQRADTGVLVLSEFAGVHDHLGAHALSVNPFQRDDIADTIARALELDQTERRLRMLRLRQAVASLSIDHWFERVTKAVRAASGQSPRLPTVSD